MAEAKAVLMPKLGQTVEESTIVTWHKKEGDAVAKGDVLFEIETDKAVLEAESFVEGTLLKVLVPEGATVPVQSVVGYVGQAGDTIPETPAAPAPEAGKKPPPPPAQKPAPREAAPPPEASQAPRAAPAPVPSAPLPAPAAPGRLRISPRARKLARDKVIDPSPITGSGPEGRIVEKDVLAYLASSGYDHVRISPAAKDLAAREELDILRVAGSGEGGRILVDDVKRAVLEKPRVMSKMRQVIARRLTESFATVPHFYVTASVDMTDLLAYRKELKAAGRDYKVTDFILQAVVLSLKEIDVVNSSTDGVSVWWHGKVHLGLAVSVENGLVVPVIRNADDLSLGEIHEAAATLGAKARAGKLTPDEMQGGTFTVSNMGMLNVENFGAIINPGEGAILAVASTLKKPVVVDGGRIAVRDIMKITLSTDHRLVDGAAGAQFVNAVRAKLEDVDLWKRLV